MKLIKILFAFILSLTILQGAEKIVIGATPVPFGEILEFSKPLFKEKGFELKVVEFSDYSIPNKALAEKSLDANLFQHKPYLDEFNKANSTNLVAAISLLITPMGVYSNKIKDIKNIANGASIAIPNDPTNESRALEILQSAGLIKLDETKALKTPLDIKENPKKLKFKELKAAQLPRVLGDVDIAVINTNYALDFGLKPVKDAIYLEKKDSPYANFVVVRPEDKDSKKTKIIREIITSQKIKDFIIQRYGDSVILTF
ncbi:methionine ABC transporter substrate-binding protein [Campylobacter sp. MIT 99-7217]|uniref:MetQ/NlpA family ABC transporter substrate-binding protein n=1 Tax=Campylobacter sp. MIT 99-7217 TaxID=535091 RepID=UPI00115A0D1F|nr:MetQ/NlpA family ABC transporter substrate-binding protein [Campylobacter sp. MIT 99-7217]TQR34450.1 methionine ABC transporter substrate-binding protein [Campylobacter sp. MIT 99-7217]